MYVIDQPFVFVRHVHISSFLSPIVHFPFLISHFPTRIEKATLAMYTTQVCMYKSSHIPKSSIKSKASRIKNPIASNH